MADLSKQTSDFTEAFYDLLAGIQGVEGGTIIDPIRYQLIGSVKVKIDEMMPEGEGAQFEVLTENVSDTLDIYINSLLDECAMTLHQIAPIDRIIGKSSIESAVRNSDGSGYIKCPTDFLRLQILKITGFERPITNKDLITPNHPNYKKQFTVLRGGIAKPVGVLTNKNISGTVYRVIEYFSLPTSTNPHVKEIYDYVPIVDAEDVQTDLVDSLTWICASKILGIVGRTEESTIAMARAMETFTNL
jgi:hypothetical protein